MNRDGRTLGVLITSVALMPVAPAPIALPAT
jgi:hypothetical protein